MHTYEALRKNVPVKTQMPLAEIKSKMVIFVQGSQCRAQGHCPWCQLKEIISCVCTPKMKSLFRTVQKLWQKLKFFCQRQTGQTLDHKMPKFYSASIK